MKHNKLQSLAVLVSSILLLLSFFALGQLINSSAAKEKGPGETRRVNAERRPSSQQTPSPLPKATPIVEPRPASSPTPLPSPKTSEPKTKAGTAKHASGLHLLSGGGTLTGRMFTSPPPSTVNL